MVNTEVFIKLGAVGIDLGDSAVVVEFVPEEMETFLTLYRREDYDQFMKHFCSDCDQHYEKAKIPQDNFCKLKNLIDWLEVSCCSIKDQRELWLAIYNNYNYVYHLNRLGFQSDGFTGSRA